MDASSPRTDIERIDSLILLLRGTRVIIDADLARLYGVPNKALNQAIRRNASRFPPDFSFQLDEAEKRELVTNCDRFRTLKHSVVLPIAFTEFGAIMAASVLNSDEAVRTSVFIVRAFVRMREILSAGVDIGHRLAEHDHRLDEHDDSIRSIIAAIHGLTDGALKPARKIGFGAKEGSE
jgi:hypothetical protein